VAPGRQAQTLDDEVDRHMAQWRMVQPDVNRAPFDVWSRLRRVHDHIEVMIDSVLADFGLVLPVFRVLACLRRQTPPFRLSQRLLMDELGLTSGTISTRIDQMVDQGLVLREADPADKRSTHVQLTAAGLAVYETCLPAYLTALDRLLSALGAEERTELANLLRRLELSFEGEVVPYSGDSTQLSVSLSPAHVTRQMQRDLGLPECAGLLVRAVEKGGAGDRAGIHVGDVLVRAGGAELHSVLSLASAISAADASELWLDVRRGAEECRVFLELRT
jgi:DNA-binding MarR family transcriptional regulator